MVPNERLRLASHEVITNYEMYEVCYFPSLRDDCAFGIPRLGILE